MPEKHIHGECHFSKGIYSFPSIKKIILIQIILLFLFFQGCVFFSSRQKAQLFFTRDDVLNIIHNVKQQQDIVSEFYSTGTLTINGWVIDTSVDIFIAAKKDPLMFKMEISHSWGKPLFYFLIKDDRLEIRDFLEKKQYTGKFTSENLSRFLPNMDCSPDMIWSFLRGYPSLFSYSHVYESAPGVLILEDRDKKTRETITFSPEEGIKEASSFPPRFPDMKFTDFRKTGDIDYAEKTVVEDIKGSKDLILKRKKVIFNKEIPDSIFTLKNKPFFEVMSLDEM
ncbi:MAG: hypothetical protein PVG39_03800 [Desulfobacteraceae bacterium]|jgi:hypothetical protein